MNLVSVFLCLGYGRKRSEDRLRGEGLFFHRKVTWLTRFPIRSTGISAIQQSKSFCRDRALCHTFESLGNRERHRRSTLEERIRWLNTCIFIGSVPGDRPKRRSANQARPLDEYAACDRAGLVSSVFPVCKRQSATLAMAGG